MNADTELELLRELCEQQRLTNERLGELTAAFNTLLAAQQPKPSRLKAADRRVLETLLPVIHRGVGEGYLWTAGELVRHAKVAGSPLARPLEEVYGALNKSTANKLGRLLGNAVDTTVCGLTLERIGTGREGAIYCLRGSVVTIAAQVVAADVETPHSVHIRASRKR